jgi:hypothetical protein
MKAQPLWGTARPRPDPRLKGANWKKTKEYWRRVGKANDVQCWRCGGRLGPILYDTWLVPGTKRVHPLAYVLGHKISRDVGRSLGYDDDWLDSPENTHPEHSRCSARSGYMAQAAKRRTQAIAVAKQLAKAPKGPTPQPGVPLSPRPVKQAAAASRW